VADYTIIFARSARKDLEAFDAVAVRRIISKIESLAGQPVPRGCRKLQGEENLWRIRVGDYRVIYAIYHKDKIVDIISVRHRSKAYE
jgi:mRNA interferase RelE/StbE